MSQDGGYIALFKIGWSDFGGRVKNVDFQRRMGTQKLEERGWAEAVTE